MRTHRNNVEKDGEKWARFQVLYACSFLSYVNSLFSRIISVNHSGHVSRSSKVLIYLSKNLKTTLAEFIVTLLFFFSFCFLLPSSFFFWKPISAQAPVEEYVYLNLLHSSD